MMTTKGLYVHVPFCVRKCNYCDFCSVTGSSEAFIDRYIDCLLREARGYVQEPKIRIDSLFFGGGTPSLLLPRQLELILEELRRCFEILPECEITLEANPGTLDENRLAEYYKLGINRLSLGLQSSHENELKKLGRIHSFDDFVNMIRMSRNIGFDNISVDLMYGIPYQTEESFGITLDKVLSLSPEHISVYGLMVEEGTPFFGDTSLNLPSEDSECEMYYLAHRRLVGAGYSHYEISNYARDGYMSRHNLKYWRDMEYIGLGASAYSYFNGVRYGNTRDLNEYVAGIGIPEYSQRLTQADLEYEYAMLALRLAEGIDLAEYEHRFGHRFAEDKQEIISKYESMGLLRYADGRLFFTEQGFYLSNTLLVNIL